MTMKKAVLDLCGNAFQALAAGYGQQDGDEDEERIPMSTASKAAQEYIKEFELDKPENLARFFVEEYFASFENIMTAVNALKAENLITVLSKIETAKDEVEIGINDPVDGRAALKQAQYDILNACNTLEGLLKSYIRQIKEIDQKNKWEFFIKSRGLLSTIDINVSCARETVSALDIAIRMQALIAMQLDQKSGAVIAKHIAFLENTLTETERNLLQAYDKNKGDAYWGQIPQKVESLKTVGAALEEYSAETRRSRIGVKNTEREGGFFKRWKKRVKNNGESVSD